MSIDCIGMLPGEVSMEYRGNITCGAMCMSVTCLTTIQTVGKMFLLCEGGEVYELGEDKYEGYIYSST
jgi:hypothetical protein